MGEIDVDKTEIFYPLLGKITFISNKYKKILVW